MLRATLREREGDGGGAAGKKGRREGRGVLAGGRVCSSCLHAPPGGLLAAGMPAHVPVSSALRSACNLEVLQSPVCGPSTGAAVT